MNIPCLAALMALSITTPEPVVDIIPFSDVRAQCAPVSHRGCYRNAGFVRRVVAPIGHPEILWHERAHWLQDINDIDYTTWWAENQAGWAAEKYGIFCE